MNRLRVHAASTGALMAAAVAFAAAMAIAAPAALEGVNALPGAQAAVTGKLIATPGRHDARSLDFVLMKIGSDQPIKRYDTELTKQLHVIAISDDFKTFLHDHVTQASRDGHLRLSMTFPRNGLYHIYADSTPTGLGQQVLRFDLPVGVPQAKRQGLNLSASGLVAADGPYSVRFDSLDLSAGQEAQLTLHIEKDGKPAADIHPFLGVSAHAVFIDTGDLSYLHVHASPGGGGAAGAMQAMPGMPGMGQMQSMPGMGQMGNMPGMGGMNMSEAPAMPPSAKVEPDLNLHLNPPKAGTYALWIQFIGGTTVRTVPFIVMVK